jgi:autotransporter-associated beta strand protein
MKSYATLLALLSASSLSGLAQTTYTWDGGNYSTSPDNNWGTAINWSSDTVPVKSSNTVLTFSGNEKATANNNLGDWALDIGQLNFTSTAMQSILTGNAFGFLPLNGSQQINQNSPNGAQIGNTFAFRSGSDSQINLNASGPLLVHSSVYLDASNSTARQLVIGGTTNDLNTLVLNGTVAKSGSGYDPDMVIQNNKRVAVFGALTFGSGTDGSVMINSGRLEFHGSGSMTGAPVIGSSSGSDSALLLLNSDGQTMANQLEILGGSSGRRVIGGQNTSGNVTFSGTVIGNNAPASYDVVAATGGSVTLSGARNLNSVLNINRPDGSTTYGGTVVLSGSSTSTSGVAVYGGTLSVGADSQLGGSGAITLDGGTLKQSAGFGISRDIVIGSNGGKIDLSLVPSSVAPTFAGQISGTGNLVLAGPGDATDFNVWQYQGLAMAGNNTYVGSTTITGGWVASAGATEFGNAGNTVVLNGGGLNFDSNRTHNYKVSLAGAGGAINVWGDTEAIMTVDAAAAISGTGQLTKSGAGTLVLSAANTYSGATRAVEGTLNVQNINALAMSTLDLATADTGAVGFTVSGTNTYNLGGLKGTRDLVLGDEFIVVGANNQSTTYAGDITGTGGLNKQGNGTLTLHGASSFYMVVNGGTLEFAAGASANPLLLRVGVSSGENGNVVIRSGTEMTAADVDISYLPGSTGAIRVEGTLNVGGQFLVGRASADGTLTIANGGRVVVANWLNTTWMNTTGTVNIESGGTLEIGRGGAGGDLTGPLTNHGSLVFNRTGESMVYGTLQGTGELVKQGAGTLTLLTGGTHTYTGATKVSAGTLVVNGSLAAASAVQVYPVATLAGSGTVAGSVLVSGTISPGDNGIGTLNTGSVLLYGTWACDINGASCDVLAITGDFFTGATAQLVVTGTPTADRYVIATYTGSLGATASSESPVLPSGYELGVDFVNKQLLLVKSVVVAPPVLTALPGASSVTKNSATLGGEVTASEATVTGRGVVYALTATNADPEIGGTGVTQLGTSGTTGAFTVSATGLTAASAYSFKAYAISSAGTRYSEAGTFTTLAQAAPSFAGYAVTVKEGKTLALSLAKILARATDPDGGAVTLTDVFGPSAEGGRVSLTGSLNYAPPVSFTGADSFDIELTGSQGGILRATIMVTVTGDVAAGLNQTELKLRDGKVDLTFRGIPGRSYTVQRSTNLLTWTTLATVVAGADGRIAFTDPSPPQPSGYYRAQ